MGRSTRLAHLKSKDTTATSSKQNPKHTCSRSLQALLHLPGSLATPSRGSAPRAMEAKMSQFFDSVGSFFTGGDNIPWCDRDLIAGVERELADAATEEQRNDSLMRLSWALVHSRQQDDVNRGISMIEASLDNSGSPLQTREKLYLLAVGNYRTGDYSKSRQLVERCLEVQPDWRQALSLKKAIEEKISKDGVIGIGIATTAVGLLIGGIAAAVARKK